MNRYVKAALIFVGGAGVGSTVAWFMTKKHYEGIMDERVAEEVQANKEWHQEMLEQECSDIRREWEMDEDEDVGYDENDENSEPEEQYVEAKKLVAKVLTERSLLLMRLTLIE